MTGKKDFLVSMYAQGKVIFDSGDSLTELRRLANLIFERGRQRLSPQEEFELLHRPKDLLHKFARTADPIARAYLATQLLDVCVRGHFKMSV